jgi:hypothetical protein
MCALALGLLVGGCGSDDGGTADDGEPTGSASATGQSTNPDAPDCAEIWVAGGKLPGSYKGCNDEGAYVPRDGMGCSSGQWLGRHDDRFYGVLGGTIHETESSLDDDMGYRDAVASCRA